VNLWQLEKIVLTFEVIHPIVLLLLEKLCLCSTFYMTSLMYIEFTLKTQQSEVHLSEV